MIDEIQGLVTDDVYHDIVNKDLPGHARLTMKQNDASIEIDSIQIEPEWAEENSVGLLYDD